jgi:hypothetical protein
MTRFVLSVLLLLFVASVTTVSAQLLNLPPPTPGVVYFWCGQNASLPNAADFVAVVDFNPLSPTYGDVIKTVSLPSDVPTLNPSGNEAHHAQVSADYTKYITGGLLSFLNGKDEVFVWDLPQNPSEGPEFAYSLNPPGACTDEFVITGGPGFLVSQMCSDTAGAPGNIVNINAETGTFSSFLANVSELTDFNPHGFGRFPDGSLTITNYILPASLLAPSAADIVFRNTCVLLDSTGNLQQVYDMPPLPAKTAGVGTGNGFMDFKPIPGDPLYRGFACGTNDNQFYLLTPGSPPVDVYDLSYLSKNPDGHGGLSAGIISYSQDGTRMVMSLLMRYVLLWNVTDPAAPRILRTFDFCNATELENTTFPIAGHPNQHQSISQFCSTGGLPGSHYVLWPHGDTRFVVVNYFLAFGLAQFPGTRTVHAFKFTDATATNFEYDFAFNPNPKLAALSASPHAVTFFPTGPFGTIVIPPSCSASVTVTVSHGPRGTDEASITVRNTGGAPLNKVYLTIAGVVPATLTNLVSQGSSVYGIVDCFPIAPGASYLGASFTFRSGTPTVTVKNTLCAASPLSAPLYL